MTLARKVKELRKAQRKKVGTKGWVRLDGGFAVRECNVIDLSDTGVQFAVDKIETVSSTFSFSLSRAGAGRRAKIKWRRGAQVGAQFV